MSDAPEDRDTRFKIDADPEDVLRKLLGTAPDPEGETDQGEDQRDTNGR